MAKVIATCSRRFGTISTKRALFSPTTRFAAPWKNCWSKPSSRSARRVDADPRRRGSGADRRIRTRSGRGGGFRDHHREFIEQSADIALGIACGNLDHPIAAFPKPRAFALPRRRGLGALLLRHEVEHDAQRK